MNDRAVSPIVATLFLLGILVAQFAIAASAFGWCPTCNTQADTHENNPWTYCHGHQFIHPACDQGAPVFTDQPDGTKWCHIVPIKQVQIGPHGISTEPVNTLVCDLVSTLQGA